MLRKQLQALLRLCTSEGPEQTFKRNRLSRIYAPSSPHVDSAVWDVRWQRFLLPVSSSHHSAHVDFTEKSCIRYARWSVSTQCENGFNVCQKTVIIVGSCTNETKTYSRIAWRHHIINNVVLPSHSRCHAVSSPFPWHGRQHRHATWWSMTTKVTPIITRLNAFIRTTDLRRIFLVSTHKISKYLADFSRASLTTICNWVSTKYSAKVCRREWGRITEAATGQNRL